MKRNSIVLGAAALFALATAGCGQDKSSATGSGERITIPNLTGFSEERAVDLIDQLDLNIRIERVDDPGDLHLLQVPSGKFPLDAVLGQVPSPDAKVPPGSTLVLYVNEERPFRPGEETFRLLTHCGLSFPIEFGGRFWLPVAAKLRRTFNPPEGFASDGYYDMGTIRRIDTDTLVYTSSTGIEVEYKPTKKRPGGCE